ncbi:sensor histidine kinase [Phenylobacterium sp.]|uniref:sensor histidine kinase n=1 Tax=Phenylobacterium sp. TaxID=1871053 RepID=UPI0035AD7DA5
MIETKSKGGEANTEASETARLSFVPMAQAAHSPRPVPTASDAPERTRPADSSHEDARRSFLRMASHELRTPLNSILGFSEILESELYGPLGAAQYKEYAGIIRTSGQRLLRLVNQVLDIARLESGAMDLALAPEPVDHALDDAVDGLADEIAQRRLTIMVHERGGLPSVQADARGLRNILANLLHNAITFSPKGAAIEVCARVVGGHVDIAILDHGPGVDPGDIPRLLQPFEQGEDALTRRIEGAGLGLPIVQLLCEAMGGRLKLASPPGAGLTAIVRLPLA